MQLTFTPRAARVLCGIIADRGGNLALRLQVRRGPGGVRWSMTLAASGLEAILVGGVPVLADPQSQSHLDGLVVDWVLTPDGQGFGIYDRSLHQPEMRLGAD